MAATNRSESSGSFSGNNDWVVDKRSNVKHDLTTIAFELRRSIPIRDRTFHTKTFSACFVGQVVINPAPLSLPTLFL
jgi:hypothetical protein